MGNKRKHLELIQEVISRMAKNLFFLRGWALTLFAGLAALFVKDSNKNYIYIVYYLIVVFWVLDGYFLSQERLFRALYNRVRKLKEEEIDFSMNTKPFQKDDRNSWILSMFSPILLIFYLPLLGLAIIVTFITK